MKYVTLADHAMREYAPDKIFAASQKAKAAIAELGGDAVINSTLGECQDDAGKLMVLPTPGGCGALRHAIWNFLDNGDSLLTTDWIWGPYRNICEEHGRFLKDFPMFNDQDTFNVEGMEAGLRELLEKQKQVLLLLNTPANNPTGYSMTKEEMDKVAAVLKKLAAEYPDRRLTFCLDVSYIDFDGSFEETRSIFDSIHDMPENMMTLVVFSMSKSYTMCGMRCGAIVCLAETKEAADLFKAAMSYSSRSVWSNVVRIAQRILVDINLNPEVKAEVDKERLVFSELITKRGQTFYGEAQRVGLKCCPYKHGYFIAIPCKNPAKVAAYLEEEHVYVVPQKKGLRFSPCAVTTDKCLRAPAIIKKAVDRVEAEA